MAAGRRHSPPAPRTPACVRASFRNFSENPAQRFIVIRRGGCKRRCVAQLHYPSRLRPPRQILQAVGQRIPVAAESRGKDELPRKPRQQRALAAHTLQADNEPRQAGIARGTAQRRDVGWCAIQAVVRGRENQIIHSTMRLNER